MDEPLDPCSEDTLLRYQRELVNGAGLAFGPFAPKITGLLCQKLSEGAGASEPPFSGNLVVATNAGLGNLIRAGFVSADKGSVLLLPRDVRTLEATRDALFIEAWRVQASMKVDPWSELAEQLVESLERKASLNELALGARSPLCHQGHVIAYATSLDTDGTRDPLASADTWDFKTGKKADPSRHAGCKSDLVLVRVQLPEKKWARVPYPAWVSAGLCLECNLASVNLRLGLAQVRPRALPAGWRSRHKHKWTRFRLPAADLSSAGRFGTVTGKVCLHQLKVTSRSQVTKEICGETTSVSIVPYKTPAFSPAGLKPELRLPVTSSHVHVWAKKGLEDGGFEISCVTCDAIVARTAVVAKASTTRKAANPSAFAVFEQKLPWFGEGDMTGELLAERK